MTDSNAATRFRISQRGLPGPALAVAGPVLGLVYITVLPLIGCITLVLLLLFRARQGLAATWRKTIRTHVTV